MKKTTNKTWKHKREQRSEILSCAIRRGAKVHVLARWARRSISIGLQEVVRGGVCGACEEAVWLDPGRWGLEGKGNVDEMMRVVANENERRTRGGEEGEGVTH